MNGYDMFNKFVAISVLLGTVCAADLQALSLDSVGVMTRDDPALPNTGFSLSFTAPRGFLSVTTDASPGNVIFNANASIACLSLLDTGKSGPNTMMRPVVGGLTTESALVDIPGVGVVNVGNNDFVGLLELTVPEGKSHVVQTRRGNFPTELEACLGDAPADQLPAGFPHGDIDFCKAQDFSNIGYVDCEDVVDHFSAWAPHLATDRTLTTGNTLFEE